MIKCNVALLLFVCLSVSFINVVEAGEVSSQQKVIYLADFECAADNTTENDSDDHSVGIAYDISANFGAALQTFVVQAKTSDYLNFAYLRPLTRAPPKAFI